VFGSIFRRGRERREAKFLQNPIFAFPQIGGILEGKIRERRRDVLLQF
jgi:hypothetical protein